MSRQSCKIKMLFMLVGVCLAEQPSERAASLLRMLSPTAGFSLVPQHGGLARTRSLSRASAARLQEANPAVVEEASVEEASVEEAPAPAPAPPPELQMPGYGQLSARQSKQFCYGLPGSTIPMGYFDPLGITNGLSPANVYRLRESEITHGRVGMMAAAGFLLQEPFHPMFPDGSNGIPHPAIYQIPALPPPFWLLLGGGIGFCEKLRIDKGWADPRVDSELPYIGSANFQKLKPDYYPGDLGFDPLGLLPKDPQGQREMQDKEINNGRLGMLAAAGFMAQEALTGSTWGPDLGCDVLVTAPWCISSS